MRKIRLDLDRLAVETFATEPGLAADGRGTVEAHDTEAGGETCAATCPATCAATCGYYSCSPENSACICNPDGPTWSCHQPSQVWSCYWSGCDCPTRGC
jgi:hypothetical protein